MFCRREEIWVPIVLCGVQWQLLSAGTRGASFRPCGWAFIHTSLLHHSFSSFFCAFVVHITRLMRCTFHSHLPKPLVSLCREPWLRPEAGQTASARGGAEKEAGRGPAGESGVQKAAGLDFMLQNVSYADHMSLYSDTYLLGFKWIAEYNGKVHLVNITSWNNRNRVTGHIFHLSKRKNFSKHTDSNKGTVPSHISTFWKSWDTHSYWTCIQLLHWIQCTWDISCCLSCIYREPFSQKYQGMFCGCFERPLVHWPLKTKL